MSTNNFKTVFCNTLQNKEGNKFLKIPFENYQDLNYFRHNIIDAINLIGRMQVEQDQGEDIGFTIQALTLILKNISLQEECNGIDNLLTE